VSASSLDKEFKDDRSHKGNIRIARKVGELIAKRALEKGIKRVVFDRSGYLYHGSVRAMAEAVREGGLEF
jgi:large subunit ribosomal protein L18